MITEGEVVKIPKIDYVICERPLMCKNNSWKIRTRTSGEGGFGNLDAPGQWLENPRFLRKSFVLLNNYLFFNMASNFDFNFLR